MSYLLWFSPEHAPKKAMEYVVFFRDGKPVVKRGRPGLLFEAVQRCDWRETEVRPEDPVRGRRVKVTFPKVKGRGRTSGATYEASPSLTQFLNGWESGEPPAEWETVKRPVMVITGRRTRRRQESVQRRKPDDTPHWWGAGSLAWPEGGNPGYMVMTLQVNAFHFLAGPKEPEPLAGHSPEGKPFPYTVEPFRSEALKLLSVPPRDRYELLTTLIDRHESTGPPTGMDVWDIFEVGNTSYHPFPTRWLSRFRLPRIVQKGHPGFCFHAPDLWAAAYVELHWSLLHNVWARKCQHPRCDAWFLATTPRGRPPKFCGVHRDTGAAELYRANLHRRFPKAAKVYNQLRSLKQRLKRGTISPAAFKQQDDERRRTLQYYASQGFAPQGAGTRGRQDRKARARSRATVSAER